MKRLIAVLSFALLVAACSSTRGNLLSRIEYHDDEVFEREESKFDGFVDWVVNHRFLPSKDGLTLRGD